MLFVSANFTAALTGSFLPLVRVDSWYNGAKVMGNVPMTAGQVTLDGTSTVAGSGQVTAAAPDASLLSVLPGTVLNAYGTELNIQAGLQLPGGAEMVSLGWFRITNSVPDENWIPYTAANGMTMFAPSGMQVTAALSDRMQLLVDAQLPTAGTVPPVLTSTLTEITRLATNAGVICEDFSSLTDVAIPKSVVYTQDRVAAIQSLAALLNLQASMSRAGALQLNPIDAGTTPVWTVSVSAAQAADIVSWTRKSDSQGIFNAVIVTGADALGNPVQGVAQQTTGPFRFGGPFNQKPYPIYNPLMVTDAQCAAAAKTMLTRLVANNSVTIPVTCPGNPALELGDVVALQLPDTTLTGPVQSISYSLPITSMTMTVAVPLSQLLKTS